MISLNLRSVRLNLYSSAECTASLVFKNVFEQLIEVPERVPVKATMNRYGALAACMSGSGPTVYGIFDDESKATACSQSLVDIVKEVFVTQPVKYGVEKVN